MMVLESISGVEDRNGRLCLLFEDKDQLAAARGMLMGDSMQAFKNALAEKTGINADIEMDILAGQVSKTTDPLAQLESF